MFMTTETSRAVDPFSLSVQSGEQPRREKLDPALEERGNALVERLQILAAESEFSDQTSALSVVLRESDVIPALTKLVEEEENGLAQVMLANINLFARIIKDDTRRRLQCKERKILEEPVGYLRDSGSSELSESESSPVAPDLSLNPDEQDLRKARDYFMQQIEKIIRYEEEFKSLEPSELLKRQESGFKALCQSAMMKKLGDITLQQDKLGATASGIMREIDAKIDVVTGYLKNRQRALEHTPKDAEFVKKHKLLLKEAIMKLRKLMTYSINQGTEKELTYIVGNCFEWVVYDEQIQRKKMEMRLHPDLIRLVEQFEYWEGKLTAAIKAWQMVEQQRWSQQYGINEPISLLPSQRTLGKMEQADGPVTSRAPRSRARQAVDFLDISSQAPAGGFHIGPSMDAEFMPGVTLDPPESNRSEQLGQE